MMIKLVLVVILVVSNNARSCFVVLSVVDKNWPSDCIYSNFEMVATTFKRNALSKAERRVKVSLLAHEKAYLNFLSLSLSSFMRLM